MLEKKNLGFSTKHICAVLLLLVFIIGCSNPSEKSEDETSCQVTDDNVDSLLFERDKANDSLLFEQVKNCPDLPRVVKLKLDLLIELKRFKSGLEYFNTLNNTNFKNTYDSLIYRAFFESTFDSNEETKIEINKSIIQELKKQLVDQPLDTLALGNYCIYSLEYNTSEFVFKKIDSMASANDYDGTYEFVISVYLPDQYKNYKKKILL